MPKVEKGFVESNMNEISKREAQIATAVQWVIDHVLVLCQSNSLDPDIFALLGQETNRRRPMTGKAIEKRMGHRSEPETVRAALLRLRRRLDEAEAPVRVLSRETDAYRNGREYWMEFVGTKGGLLAPPKGKVRRGRPRKES